MTSTPVAATHPKHAACTCGKVWIETSGPVLFRARCHCTICQSFNRAAFGDIVALRARDVGVEGADHLALKAHKTPPLLQRGTCDMCDAPIVEFLRIPGLPKTALIPVRAFSPDTPLPEPDMHIFYEHRLSDAQDDAPKHSGYLTSEWQFTKALLRGLRATR